MASLEECPKNLPESLCLVNWWDRQTSGVFVNWTILIDSTGAPLNLLPPPIYSIIIHVLFHRFKFDDIPFIRLLHSVFITITKFINKLITDSYQCGVDSTIWTYLFVLAEFQCVLWLLNAVSLTGFFGILWGSLGFFRDCLPRANVYHCQHSTRILGDSSGTREEHHRQK